MIRKAIFLLLTLVGLTLAHGSHYLPNSGFGIVKLNPATKIQTSTLIADTGKETNFPITGVPQIIYFGYTNCPDSCPLTLYRISQAYKKLSQPASVQLLFITLDPSNDTPKVLNTYLKNFAPTKGLTGSPAQIAKLSDQFLIKYNPGPGGSRIYHTDVIALINSKGELEKLIYGAMKLDIDDFVAELKALK